MRVYVITGPAYAEADGWTAFLLCYQHHAMPMVARGDQLTGEAGGSRFLRHALTYGVAPTVLRARDWRNVCPEARSSGSEPLFPVDILMRGVVPDNRLPTNSDFRAGRSARASASIYSSTSPLRTSPPGCHGSSLLGVAPATAKNAMARLLDAARPPTRVSVARASTYLSLTMQ